jgi:hypothetical protein
VAILQLFLINDWQRKEQKGILLSFMASTIIAIS